MQLFQTDFSTEINVSSYSIAVHPDKIRVASGQTAGHDRKEGKVSFTKILLWSCDSSHFEFTLIMKVSLCWNYNSSHFLQNRNGVYTYSKAVYEIKI